MNLPAHCHVLDALPLHSLHRAGDMLQRHAAQCREAPDLPTLLHAVLHAHRTERRAAELLAGELGCGLPVAKALLNSLKEVRLVLVLAQGKRYLLLRLE